MRFIQLSLCITLISLCGCGKDVKSTEAKEERNPLIREGQAYMEIKEYAKAEAAFKQALENNPGMARPHLDLATIYHQYKTNYIHSIYHYNRYLELRPASEKGELIREQISKVHTALYNEILTQSGAYQLKREFNQLQKENAELRRRLAARPGASKETAPKPSVTQTVPKSAKPGPSTQTTHQIYTVVPGDNLTKIAQKFYGDGNYDVIYEANKDRMKSPDDLREGQTLVIPNR